MFGIGKKSTKKGKVEAVSIDPKIAEQVHIMPQRFYVARKEKRVGLVIMISLGIILIVGLSIFGYYLNESLNTKYEPPAVNMNQNLNINTNNTNQNTNVNVNFNVNDNLNANTNVNTNENLNTNQNNNVNENVNTSTSTDQTIPSAVLDSDGDGLTRAEEILFGTNPDNSDSDGDNYLDGDELLSGYDPTKPNASLPDSTLFATHQGSDFSIIFPTSWQLKDLSETEVIFQAASGEFIEVITILKPGNLSLSDWYQEQFPDSNLSLVTQIKINNFTGLRSNDNLTYYMVSNDDPNQVYLITYNIGILDQPNFTTTFNVMVKNFIK